MSEMSITIFWRACFQVRWVFVWTWGAFEALPHKQVGRFFIQQDLHEPDGFTKEGASWCSLKYTRTWWPWRVVGGHLLAEPGRPLLLSLPSGGVWHKWQMWGGAGWLAGALLSVIPLPPPVTAIYFSFRIQHRATTSRCRSLQDHASASSSNWSSLKPFPWSTRLVQTLSERKKKGKSAIFCLYWPAGFFWPLCISTA